MYLTLYVAAESIKKHNTTEKQRAVQYAKQRVKLVLFCLDMAIIFYFLTKWDKYQSHSDCIDLIPLLASMLLMA